MVVVSLAWPWKKLLVVVALAWLRRHWKNPVVTGGRGVTRSVVLPRISRCDT